jgi:hypothetical protein
VGGASSSSSSAAASSSSFGGLPWFWRPLLGGAVLLMGLMGFCCCGGCGLMRFPGGSVTPVTNQSAASVNGGSLEMHFKGQLPRGTELFVDDKVHQPFAMAYNNTFTLPLEPGEHDVAFKVNGEKALAQKVTVKPSQQGVTVLNLPEIADPKADGVLRLEIKIVGSYYGEYWNNVELFIDDHPRTEELNYTSKNTTATLNFTLAPTEHTIVLKKNGIMVYSGTVLVKRPAEGTTFASVPLVVMGTIVIINPSPIIAGVAAHVKVDGRNGPEWPVGTSTIEVSAEVGQRLIEVVTTKPVDRVIARFDANVEPGKKFEYKIAR